MSKIYRKTSEYIYIKIIDTLKLKGVSFKCIVQLFNETTTNANDR